MNISASFRFDCCRLLWLVGVVLLPLLARAADSTPQRPFEYPVAPDTCSTLESRCHYIIAHFWDNYDITRPIRDEAAFERAFRDYVDFYRYAHRNVALSAARDFVFRSQSNAKNLPVVGRVAEKALYGPLAEYWSDEVYVEFARALSQAKPLPKADREHYRAQVAAIEACQPGNTLDMALVGADGQRRRLSDIAAKGYLLLLADGNADSRIACTRLGTDATINQLIASGNLTVLLVRVDKPASGWADGMPENWVCAVCPDTRLLDIRMVPCCYLLGAQRELLNKNIDIDTIKEAFANR